MNRTVMVTHHLQHNHFPAISTDFVPVAEAAIDAVMAWRFDVYDPGLDEALDVMLTLPNGHEHSVREVMDAFHLWDFVPTTHDDDDIDNLSMIVDLEADEGDDEYVDEDVERDER